MTRIAVGLCVVGLGSLLLELTDRPPMFLLYWARDYQPTVGISLVIAGIAIFVMQRIQRNQRTLR